MPLKNVTALIAATSLTALMSACATSPADKASIQTAANTVDVTISARYRERIALTPGHSLTVSVQDTSLADAPSITLATQTLALDRGIPEPVTLKIPSDQIKPNHSYSARADIRDNEGRLRFVTDTHTPVLTRGAGNSVSIIMVSAR